MGIPARPLESTVDHHPDDADAHPEPLRPAVTFAAGPRSPAGTEIEQLLRTRLRFFGILFGVLYMAGLVLTAPSIVILLSSGELVSWYVWHSFAMNVVGTPVFLGLTARLWMRGSLSLRRLRIIEMVLFGLVALDLVGRQVVLLWASPGIPHVTELFRAGSFDLAYLLGESLNANVLYPWALVIVLYGILIPNTGRRCAVIIGTMALLPCAVTLTAGLTGVLALAYCFQSLLWVLLWLSPTVAIAIYGSHRIESLRRQASEARRLGQYQLQRRLGAGGMGEVYLAEHVLLKRPCAIKLIRPERAGDPRNLQRFEREVKTTATLSHPNTVQIFDYGHAEDGTFYYVMEYLPGLTLEQLVEQQGPLAPARAVHFLRQVCGALREAHAAGLIHRDIKPSNVMVCERGGVHDTAKLLDFGLVLPRGNPAQDAKLTQDGAFAGTPAYMSPEQAGGQEGLDARSDIYSVGAVAYFLLTGRPLFTGRTVVKMLAAHLYEEPEPISTHRPGIPADLEAVILRCLAKDSAKRFPDAESLELALAQCPTVGEWTRQAAGRCWSRCEQGAADIERGAGRTSRCT
jgi:serine/threonine-protein kinase